MFVGRVEDFQKLRAGIKIVDNLPHTSTGKLKRNAIRSKEIEKLYCLEVK